MSNFFEAYLVDGRHADLTLRNFDKNTENNGAIIEIQKNILSRTIDMPSVVDKNILSDREQQIEKVFYYATANSKTQLPKLEAYARYLAIHHFNFPKAIDLIRAWKMGRVVSLFKITHNNGIIEYALTSNDRVLLVAHDNEWDKIFKTLVKELLSLASDFYALYKVNQAILTSRYPVVTGKDGSMFYLSSPSINNGIITLSMSRMINRNDSEPSYKVNGYLLLNLVGNNYVATIHEVGSDKKYSF